MGVIVKPDLALTSNVMSAYLGLIQERIDQVEEEADKRLWISVGAYSALCFCASLRGNEGFLLDLHGLRLYIAEGLVQTHDRPHVVGKIQKRNRRTIPPSTTSPRNTKRDTDESLARESY